jgi:hypothetical protein
MTSFVHHLGVHRQKASHASSWPAKAVTFKRASHERKDFEGVSFFFFLPLEDPPTKAYSTAAFFVGVGGAGRWILNLYSMLDMRGISQGPCARDGDRVLG